MRIPLALATAAFAVGGLAPAADATCMTHYDRLTGISRTYCAAPGGPVTTTICFPHIPEPHNCVSYTSGGGGGGTT